MSRKSYKAVVLKELPIVAKSIIEHIGEHKMIAFYGEMGAGKTTLIKEICKVLEVDDDVSSPTYSLVNEYYSSKEGSIYHFDFYRIKDEVEALDIGIEEYFYSGNYCLIEWPEKIPNLLVDNLVRIEINLDNDNRSIDVITP